MCPSKLFRKESIIITEDLGVDVVRPRVSLLSPKHLENAEPRRMLDARLRTR